MAEIKTTRLVLHALDGTEARRVRNREPSAADRWADDYPFEGDLAALDGFLRGIDRDGEQRPFGYYQITRQSDGLAIGGAGFKGSPVAGVVEVGYGLVPTARGHGYAAEALLALMAIASRHDVVVMRTSTTPENTPSRRTLERAGFDHAGSDDELLHYRASLG